MLDVNRSGTIDPGDKGLADVPVSDGIQIVRTAADGSFSIKFADDPLIPYKPSQVLSVCWPSGTWPVEQRFFVRRADIKPGQAVDFLVREQKQTLPFTFAHGTDPHDNLGVADGGFGDDIKRMDRQVQFCLMTGDLGYADRENAEKMFSSIHAATKRFPIPMLHTCGNHDIVGIHSERWSEQHPLAGYGPYTRYVGPIRYSFNYAGIHFVGLDWARIVADGKLQTGVPDGVIDWLKKDLDLLKPGTRTFVFMHSADRKPSFWDVLAEHKVELLLAGHTHVNDESVHRGVHYLRTQNLMGPYRLVTVTEQGYDIVNRCYAGSGSGHVHSYAGRCKITVDPRGKDRGIRGKVQGDKMVVHRTVKTAEAIEGVLAQQLAIAADIEPGTAKQFGLRLVPDKDKEALVEVRCCGDDLQLGEMRTAAVRARGEQDFRLLVLVEGGKVLVYANNRMQLEKPCSVKQPCRVMLFADDGAAVFKNVTVWQLKGE